MVVVVMAFTSVAALRVTRRYGVAIIRCMMLAVSTLIEHGRKTFFNDNQNLNIAALKVKNISVVARESRSPHVKQQRGRIYGRTYSLYGLNQRPKSCRVPSKCTSIRCFFFSSQRNLFYSIFGFLSVQGFCHLLGFLRGWGFTKLADVTKLTSPETLRIFATGLRTIAEFGHAELSAMFNFKLFWCPYSTAQFVLRAKMCLKI